MALRLVPTPLPDPNPHDSLGERIESARGFRRLTQQEVVTSMKAAAVRLGLKPPALRTYSEWVADRTSPTVRQLTLLAEALDTTPDWFVRDMSEEPDGGPGLGVTPSGCNVRTVDFGSRLRRTPLLTADAA